MKGDPKVIELLNEALKAELTAINQYWLHYRMLDNWGITGLAEFERHESIDEMKHADRFSERILFLEGLPTFQALDRLRIGESVHDFVSRDLFVEVLRDEEGHVDKLETQFEMIKSMGLQNYIQLQSEPAKE